MTPFDGLDHLKSVGTVSIVKRDKDVHPHYLSNHKSILGDMVKLVIQESRDVFKSFKISCAGSDSPEIVSIKNYISETFKLVENDDADLKITIGKSDSIWEIAVQIFVRPLSLRSYKIANLKGALNPTIAYAMNRLADVSSAQSYLNPCSGSGTLLIEACMINPQLKLVGFDIDGKHNALAVQNIKKAGFIKSIQLKTADVLDRPELGMFDIIASDLPFGMLVSKHENLRDLYQGFANYCHEKLTVDGKLVVYTTEHEMLQELLIQSNFHIIKTLELVVSTNSNSYLTPKIFLAQRASVL